MRKLSFIFMIVMAVVINSWAQTTTAAAGRVFDEGTRAARAGEYEKALENYRNAMFLSESEKTSSEFLARIRFNAGVCLYHLKRTGEAVEEFTKAIELGRGNYQKAFYALGMAHSELKNWKSAEMAFRAAVRLEKEDGEAWFDLALVLLEVKDFEAARAGFQNAIKYKSLATADAHNNIGVILALKGDMTSAENEFETALRKSGGKSLEAGNNLQFCRLYKQSLSQNLRAGPKFSRL